MIFKPTITNVISRIFGKFASHRFITPLQYIINYTYVKSMKVDLSEFDTIGSYKSLNELFTRKLKKQRDISLDKSIIISPCDSLITECGEMFISRTMQIKGFYYKADELLTTFADKNKVKKIYNGEFINFYLSPKDYHRYHVPVDLQVLKVIHVPGLLYPVNLKYLNKVFDLFVKNERVILECKIKEDKILYMVFVAALNVGKMKFNFDKRIQTNIQKDSITTYQYADIHLKKGEELGRFEMGSTIVMFFEKDSVKLTCERMKKVRFGEKVAKLL